MTDLSLVSTNDLLDEMKKRFDTFVISGVLRKTEKSSSFLIDWDGDQALAIYLCELTKRDVLDYFHDTKQESKE